MASEAEDPPKDAKEREEPATVLQKAPAASTSQGSTTPRDAAAPSNGGGFGSGAMYMLIPLLALLLHQFAGELRPDPKVAELKPGYVMTESGQILSPQERTQTFGLGKEQVLIEYCAN